MHIILMLVILQLLAQITMELNILLYGNQTETHIPLLILRNLLFLWEEIFHFQESIGKVVGNYGDGLRFIFPELVGCQDTMLM